MEGTVNTFHTNDCNYYHMEVCNFKQQIEVAHKWECPSAYLPTFRKIYVLCKFCWPQQHIYQCYKMMKLKLSSSFSLKTMPALCVLSFNFTWPWFHLKGSLFNSPKGRPLLCMLKKKKLVCIEECTMP